MVRDQYQGGSTVMSAISGVEIAMWDLIGKNSGGGLDTRLKMAENRLSATKPHVMQGPEVPLLRRGCR